METATDWTQPTPVTDVEVTFPANALDLMPAMDEIPEEFTRQRNTWVKFQMDWFFDGIADMKATPRDGIDKPAALRHLNVIQRSYAPKHQHKEAAVAYLASLWFTRITGTVKGRAVTYGTDDPTL